MMKYLLTTFTVLSAIAAPVSAAAIVGQAAPNFTLPDVNGKRVSLSAFRGKTVVIEWNNPDCPFVKKHYNSGNMQRTQVAAAKDSVVWLSINSSAPGNQGNVTGPQAKAYLAKSGARPSAYLLDPDGVVGKKYGARTTPHMFIVNKAGRIVYAGGIDDKPSPNPADIKSARNHVLGALSELKSGKAVSIATSRPYGCAVKYRDS
jgi:hypothetical protein